MSLKPRILATSIDNDCAIARSLGVLSDTWSFLLLREVHLGRYTFAEFRDHLGIATDVLSARLASLVEHGVLERIPYQEAGQRGRYAYKLTPAGEELKIVLIAMQQWGEKHISPNTASRVHPLTRDGGNRVYAHLVDAHGNPVTHTDVGFEYVDAQ